MSSFTRYYPGRVLRIKAGTLVRRSGSLSKRTQDAIVTVKRTAPARNGKTRVYWKSHGILASALIR